MQAANDGSQTDDAMGESLATHVDTGDNMADLATKIIPHGMKRCRMVDRLLCDVESNSTVEVDTGNASTK